MLKKVRFSVVQGFWLLIFAYSAALMAEITWRYRSFALDANFLMIKQSEIEALWWYKYAFYVHVCSAILALPAGFTQFNRYLLKRYPRLHRVIGYSYVLSILMLAAPSGLLIGVVANGGILAIISFELLAVGWFYFTWQATRSAFRKNFNAHRDFMLRSFALTCSALTLRFWKVILIYFFQPNPMDVYQIIAWLGWVPNLLLVELIIYFRNRGRQSDRPLETVTPPPSATRFRQFI
ncbi:DUF2306 domain-containing protein [Sphingobacterium thalpophilum]|uniref:Predicted membrane protein (DUF2306) n=1 Tax=Sphingobacterium thalpophilum TaxID=259 RepID=A0A4U9W631_9SPHI|nr:DUF2306 domain-containing protein [Sphingobacterium thalpophilum]VTR54223.1 Predicted membrane protein (DUF2306) [Sphingobacterium thalpophilum]